MDHHLADGAALRSAFSRSMGALAALAAMTALTALAPACNATDPTPGAEARCTARCLDEASRCAPTSCERGCRFVLDRLVEHEGATVLACVARSTREQCASDSTWARCAVELGPYVDGGPPPPHIERWDEEKDDNSE